MNREPIGEIPGRASEPPAALGYYFPAEFEPHVATWLSWPHKQASWPGKMDNIYPYYGKFVQELAASEAVRININNQAMKDFAVRCLTEAGADLGQIEFFFHPTNDAWCRDHGPAFLINPAAQQKKVIVDWNYNAWGNKYPPYDLDDIIPTRIARHYDMPLYHPGIVMEGGSVDFNGQGILLTSTCCLLNPNRNPGLGPEKIEEYLRNYYGVSQILWISKGIVGDDTDGHIDDTVRFVNSDTVLAAIEHDRRDENYSLLQHNLVELRNMHLPDGRGLNIIELPMPPALYYEGQRLPASYANFYIANRVVIVPTYRCDQDDKALDIIAGCFPGRKTVGIDSMEIIWGLGSFHCLSQQEPLV